MTRMLVTPNPDPAASKQRLLRWVAAELGRSNQGAVFADYEVLALSAALEQPAAVPPDLRAAAEAIVAERLEQSLRSALAKIRVIAAIEGAESPRDVVKSLSDIVPGLAVGIPAAPPRGP